MIGVFFSPVYDFVISVLNSRPTSQLPPQPGVQVLLVDLAHLAVPAVMRQQGGVPGGDDAHLHGAGGPLHRVEVVQPAVQDEGRGPAVWRPVSRVSEPRGLRHRIPGDEHTAQLLLGQRLGGEDLPDFGLAGGGSLVVWRDVHRVNGAEAVDDVPLGVGREDVGHGELGRGLAAAEVGHVQQTVDEGGDRLVVAPRVLRRDWRREAREADVRFSLVKRCCYDNNVIQRVCRARVSDVVELIEAGCGACRGKLR